MKIEDEKLIKRYKISNKKSDFKKLHDKYHKYISAITNNIVGENYGYIKEDSYYLLYLAVKDYDETKNAKFKSFLSLKIKWHYLNAINKEKVNRDKSDLFFKHGAKSEEKYHNLQKICKENGLGVIFSKFFVGKSLTEISKDLSCSKSQITKLFQREIKTLKKIYE